MPGRRCCAVRTEERRSGSARASAAARTADRMVVTQEEVGLATGERRVLAARSGPRAAHASIFLQRELLRIRHTGGPTPALSSPADDHVITLAFRASRHPRRGLPRLRA